ncbi:MAG: hypothetical protein RLZ32_2451 [Gemmatimonadota bacterium]|jgi:excisionase family DNA binding protein
MSELGPLPEDRLWTVQDVSRYAQTSRSWVYQRAAEGALPSVKLGGLLRFDPQAIKQFFRTGGGTSPTRTVIPLNAPIGRKGER